LKTAVVSLFKNFQKELRVFPATGVLVSESTQKDGLLIRLRQVDPANSMEFVGSF